MADAVVLLAVLALSVSQLFQKLAVERARGDTTPRGRWLTVLSRPELAIALLLLAGGTALWLYALYQMDVSRAFPFLSLGSVLVTLISRFLLKERVDAMRWGGVLLVALGVMLVAAT
jgi:drug/metabolite transporter (DMT)-like permease